MLATARKHFDEDISRAQAMLDHANGLAPPLSDDILRAAWVLAVGALDAYLCDAYVDLLASQLRAYRDKAIGELPPQYAKVKLPAGAVLRPYEARSNWALRMAGRAIMQEQNMLQISRAKEMLNPALLSAHKLWDGMMEALILQDVRGLCGVTATEYRGMSSTQKQSAKKSAGQQMLRKLGRIIQRRHDIAHNCDRPKMAVGRIGEPNVRKAINYIRTFVQALHDHLEQHRTC